MPKSFQLHKKLLGFLKMISLCAIFLSTFSLLKIKTKNRKIYKYSFSHQISDILTCYVDSGSLHYILIKG